MDRLPPNAPNGEISYPLAVKRQPVMNPQPAIRLLQPQHQQPQALQPPPLPYNQMLQMQHYHPQVVTSQFSRHPAHGVSQPPPTCRQPYQRQEPSYTQAPQATHYAYRNNPAARAQPQRYRQPTSSQQPLGQPFVQREIVPSSPRPSNGSEDMDISDVETSSPHYSIGSGEMNISEDEEKVEPGRNENVPPVLRTRNSRLRDEEEMTMLLNLSSHAPAQVEEPALDPYSTEAEDLPAPFHSPPTLETARGHWAAYKSLKKGENTIPLLLHTTYSIPPPQLYAATISSTPAATERLADSSAITPSKAKTPGADPQSTSEGPSTKENKRVKRKATDFGSWSSPEDQPHTKRNF